jgi:hypothetical protein
LCGIGIRPARRTPDVLSRIPQGGRRRYARGPPPSVQRPFRTLRVDWPRPKTSPCGGARGIYVASNVATTPSCPIGQQEVQQENSLDVAAPVRRQTRCSAGVRRVNRIERTRSQANAKKVPDSHRSAWHARGSWVRFPSPPPVDQHLCGWYDVDHQVGCLMGCLTRPQTRIGRPLRRRKRYPGGPGCLRELAEERLHRTHVGVDRWLHLVAVVLLQHPRRGMSEDVGDFLERHADGREQ